MKLRNQLLALSLLTLLLPWSGWKLLQELERFLREAQEGALLASARTLAGALPLEFQSRLVFAPERYLPLRKLDRPPVLDGYAEDWPDSQQGLEFRSGDGKLTARLLAAGHADRLFLHFDIGDAQVVYASPGEAPAIQGDGLTLLVRNPRGLLRFDIRPEAPGPLQLRSDGDGEGQVEGVWLDVPTGYQLELVLPVSPEGTDLNFVVSDIDPQSREPDGRTAGPSGENGPAGWISLIAEWRRLSEWLAASTPADSRAWLVDDEGWVLADSGATQGSDSQQTTWLQRLLYRLVAGSRTELLEQWADDPVRLADDVAQQALAGEEGLGWSQDIDTAVVRNTVAVPVDVEGRTRGAVVLQSASEGLLLVTNRALGRLLLTTLALTFGLAAGLWYFATRLSRRVQRLSGAVSQAMEGGAHPEVLPLTTDRDELGELARNNEKLLRAVADYNQYLQTLAGKLSHELKTPLAITRSSLDNLSSQVLDIDSRRFLERAQEGLDRQAAIVRAMSEASRLEAAIRAADWEEIDLAKLIGDCVEAYRSVNPERELDIELPGGEIPFLCAPDLLAQALDKLVDNAITLSGPADKVTISLEQLDADAEYCLSVHNTGSSLPEDFRDRLFDSLVSLRDKRGSAPHLGLGLYIVRLVADAHGGSVSAENSPDGQGVEFRICLPVVSPSVGL
jgi:dedicated sortase system histidine kinase